MVIVHIKDLMIHTKPRSTITVAALCKLWQTILVYFLKFYTNFWGSILFYIVSQLTNDLEWPLKAYISTYSSIFQKAHWKQCKKISLFLMQYNLEIHAYERPSKTSRTNVYYEKELPDFDKLIFYFHFYINS